MVNSLLLLSGIGMIIIGLITPIYYWRTKRVRVKYFAFGALVWFFAFIAKIIMDLTISGSIGSYLFGIGTIAYVIVYGLYIGLRTGLFESGFSYVFALKIKLQNITKKQAIAFGLGFGCFEALFIGFFSFINILFYVLNPSIINILPEQQAELITQMLNQSTWTVPAAIIERIAVIIIHVFTTLLVFYSLKISNKKYLCYSIGFKTIVDGIIPALGIYIGAGTITGLYLMEIPFIGLGIISLFGIKWISSKWGEKDT